MALCLPSISCGKLPGRLIVSTLNVVGANIDSFLVRAPCPVMNTLANHNFVPHDGRNITRQPFIEACGEAFNMSPEFADGIFTNGVPSNPTPNATVRITLLTYR